jgi:hypothetical protein
VGRRDMGRLLWLSGTECHAVSAVGLQNTVKYR